MALCVPKRDGRVKPGHDGKICGVRYAVLSTNFPMPDGGGACFDEDDPWPLSFAGCGGVCCGDVPVFGMMTWMPILMALMSGALLD
jgi:hypothetical protein